MPIIKTDKELRDRDARDYYPTPKGLVRAALRKYERLSRRIHSRAPVAPRTIIDPGAGSGAWGEVAREIWPNAGITGVDLHFPDKPPAYDLWRNHDYIATPEPAVYSGADLVMGNPPYKFAEEFVRQAHRDTNTFGRIVFLLRLSFLESQGRALGLWREYPPAMVSVLDRRPSFTGNRKTDSDAYAVYFWIKGQQFKGTMLDWLVWEYDEGEQPKGGKGTT